MTAGSKLPGTPEPMHHWSGLHGLRIAGDSWGNPEGPLVILQHGGGQTRHAWRGTGIRLAAAGYYVVALDARGHGDSEWDPAGEYDLVAMVRELKCLVTALGSRRPVLVGASMGGATSLVAVGEGHVDATALVMVDVAPKVESAGVAEIHAFMNQNPQGFDSLEEVAKAISTYQPHRERPRKLDGLGKNVRLGADGKLRWHWDPKFRAEEFRLELRPERLEECARRLTVPTLLVRGGLSDVLSEEGAQEFLKLCAHSEYVSVTNAAHMVAGDRNDIFAEAVIEFLARAVPADGSAPKEADTLRPEERVPAEVTKHVT